MVHLATNGPQVINCNYFAKSGPSTKRTAQIRFGKHICEIHTYIINAISYFQNELFPSSFIYQLQDGQKCITFFIDVEKPYSTGSWFI